ncbi:uncharacterized protein EV422DRAFT_166434 [Fimicolochytrium jonesii]|uniref:uncharacterized protein n=1 Tax=Fimicolochytrium jonesii TaxID=1396493 RepID=UPI0022FE26D2|nr:uncharacterized protein EV422DRAFT_166434 [Fimicolochytrium jonesii]KAI8818817.1 hypothetical protein EV422DRAFT_166434 [Fimicolochytrium jonesii]
MRSDARFPTSSGLNHDVRKSCPPPCFEDFLWCPSPEGGPVGFAGTLRVTYASNRQAGLSHRQNTSWTLRQPTPNLCSTQKAAVLPTTAVSLTPRTTPQMSSYNYLTLLLYIYITTALPVASTSTQSPIFGPPLGTSEITIIVPSTLQPSALIRLRAHPFLLLLGIWRGLNIWQELSISVLIPDSSALAEWLIAHASRMLLIDGFFH